MVESGKKVCMNVRSFSPRKMLRFMKDKPKSD